MHKQAYFKLKVLYQAMDVNSEKYTHDFSRKSPQLDIGLL